MAASLVDAAIEVHRLLGPGYTEGVYEDALCVELQLRGIVFERQVAFDLSYKGHRIGSGRLDLLVNSMLVVELKSTEALHPLHTAQVISYLKMTGLSLGLLMNFNCPLMKTGIKRIVLTPSPLAPSRLGGGISEVPHGQ